MARLLFNLIAKSHAHFPAVIQPNRQSHAHFPAVIQPNRQSHAHFPFSLRVAVVFTFFGCWPKSTQTKHFEMASLAVEATDAAAGAALASLCRAGPVVITGAGSGIGAAVATALCQIAAAQATKDTSSVRSIDLVLSDRSPARPFAGSAAAPRRWRHSSTVPASPGAPTLRHRRCAGAPTRCRTSPGWRSASWRGLSCHRRTPSPTSWRGQTCSTRVSPMPQRTPSCRPPLAGFTAGRTYDLYPTGHDGYRSAFDGCPARPLDYSRSDTWWLRWLLRNEVRCFSRRLCFCFGGVIPLGGPRFGTPFILWRD